MTREEVKELMPIMQAFAEGKEIQDKIEFLRRRIQGGKL